MTTKFAFVSAKRGNHAVGTLCRVLGVSVSGFYAWLRAIPSLQSLAETEAELRGHIGGIFAARRRVYGSPRVHAELRRDTRRRVERLMREMGRSASQGCRPLPQTLTAAAITRSRPTSWLALSQQSSRIRSG